MELRLENEVVLANSLILLRQLENILRVCKIWAASALRQRLLVFGVVRVSALANIPSFHAALGSMNAANSIAVTNPCNGMLCARSYHIRRSPAGLCEGDHDTSSSAPLNI
jgi:hypothetical protein